MSDQDVIDALPPIKEILNQHDIRADKKFGQNFLLDINLTKKIVRLAGDIENHHIIEVGPGPGGLTRALLASNAAAVTAIEMDPRFIDLLSPLDDMCEKPFRLIQEDALEIDITDISKTPRSIIANLPYNVATPLLIGWLKQADKIASMALMFQKEVGERIVASQGDKAYGRLGILANYLCHVKKLITLPPGAFTPPPKVHSAVIQLIPRDDVKDRLALVPSLEHVTGLAFNQRRKMIRSSLKPLLTQYPSLLSDLGINETKRAEELSLDQFIALAKYIDDRKKS